MMLVPFGTVTLWPSISSVTSSVLVLSGVPKSTSVATVCGSKMIGLLTIEFIGSHL
jgi:hypothetical protein